MFYSSTCIVLFPIVIFVCGINVTVFPGSYDTIGFSGYSTAQIDADSFLNPYTPFVFLLSTTVPIVTSLLPCVTWNCASVFPFCATKRACSVTIEYGKICFLWHSVHMISFPFDLLAKLISPQQGHTTASSRRRYNISLQNISVLRFLPSCNASSENAV